MKNETNIKYEILRVLKILSSIITCHFNFNFLMIREGLFNFQDIDYMGI